MVFQYMDQEKYGTYSAYPIYSGEEQYENNTQFNVGWMFAEAKDFSFATAKEAEGAVRAALSVLGVSDLILLRTLYIDHNIMEAAGKKLATEPQYAPIGETKENNGYPIREDWSSADDAYMFSFGISVNGTPLATRFEVRDTSTYGAGTLSDCSNSIRNHLFIRRRVRFPDGNGKTHGNLSVLRQQSDCDSSFCIPSGGCKHTLIPWIINASSYSSCSSK